MERRLALLLAGFALSIWLPASSATSDNQTRFSPGQIWSYKTRPQDAGSLIKIYRTETLGSGDRKIAVYHISMIGLSLGKSSRDQQIGHLPVSIETLDMSVTKLLKSDRKFPDASEVDEGIAIWRKDEGGVFTISLSEIVDVVEKSIPKGT
jgi:hypothetical protein